MPVVIWNFGNGFESFRFQSGDRWAKAQFGTHWIVQCLVGQFAVLNPAVAVLLPFVVHWLWRQSRRGDQRARWLLAFGLPMPLFMLANAWFVQVKINWFLPAYVPLLIGLLLWWRESGVAVARPRRLRAAAITILAMTALAPLAPLARFVPQPSGSSWSGWDRIAAAAEALGGVDRPGHQPGGQRVLLRGRLQGRRATGAESLAAHDHRSGGQASGTCARARAGAKRVRRPSARVHHWNQPATHLGQDAIFV